MTKRRPREDSEDLAMGELPPGLTSFIAPGRVPSPQEWKVIFERLQSLADAEDAELEYQVISEAVKRQNSSQMGGGRLPSTGWNQRCMPESMLALLPSWAGGFGVRRPGFPKKLSEVAQANGMTHREVRLQAIHWGAAMAWEAHFDRQANVRVGRRWIEGRRSVVPKDALSPADLQRWIKAQAESLATKWVLQEHASLNPT